MARIGWAKKELLTQVFTKEVGEEEEYQREVVVALAELRRDYPSENCSFTCIFGEVIPPAANVTEHVPNAPNLRVEDGVIMAY